jgi:hypothetical protein
MNWDRFPLSMFEVDCDGSACGSGNTGLHVHAPQNGRPAVARVTVRENRRTGYSDAAGITRLVTADAYPGESR